MLTALIRPTPPQHRPITLARWQGAGLALLLATTGVLAQPAAKPASAKPASTKPANAKAPAGTMAKPASARQKLKNEATGLALASETAETIDELQLAIAARVLTGNVDCEFNQRISVLPLAGKRGFFTVTYFSSPHKSQRYSMAPRETATGAVRLEDKAAGVVWLQIPTKSMLMNARAGQRMVDGCLHAEQRIAVAAAAAAGAAPVQGIGIVAQPPQMATPAPVVVAPAVVPIEAALPAAGIPAAVAPDAGTPAAVTPAAVTPAIAAPPALPDPSSDTAAPAPPAPPVPPTPPAADITAAPVPPSAATR